MTKRVFVQTKNYGNVECEIFLPSPEDSNTRIYPINGVSLVEWRENTALLPPYLIPSDLVEGTDAWLNAVS